MDTFAQRLKYARQRAKMSQEELARKLDVSKAMISKVEMGLTQDVYMTTLFHMADAMSIDPRWLATGKSPVGETAIGLPGESGILEAWAELPEEIREPLRELVEKAAKASKQRYWAWIEERDNR
jgi:transcriptional regulator with XRE-family HTH domain